MDGVGSCFLAVSESSNSSNGEVLLCYHNVDIEGAHNHDSHISRYPTFEVNFYTLISVDHYNHIAFSSSKSSRDGLWN